MSIWVKVDEGHHIDFSRIVAVWVDHTTGGGKGYGVAKMVSPSGDLVDIAITEAHPYKEAADLVEKAMTQFQERLKGGTKGISVKRQ
jgi:hypothetical protein